MLRSIRPLAVLVAVSCATPAFADPPQSPPDPTRIAAAERLLTALNYDALIDRLTEAMIVESEKAMPDQLARMAEALGKEPPPPELLAKVQTSISKAFRDSMRENRQELRRGTALIYASRFTVAEIDHIAELQKDPVMIKMQAELPAISAEGSALGRAVLSRKMPEILKDIEAIVEEYYRGKS
jgi:hypothetical protein